MFDTLVRRIEELSKTQPDKRAVAFKNEILSYAELYLNIKRTSEILKKNGAKEGDRISLSAVSKPLFVVTYLAIEYMGA